MTAPTFKLCNLHFLNRAAATRKQNFKSITAPLCCGNCISFRCELISKTSGDAVTNFLVTFETSTLRWLVSVALWVALIWHFVRGPNLTFWPLPRACLPGRVFEFTFLMGCWFQIFLVFTDVARLNWPFAWWFLSSFWLLSAEITFALIAGASVWRG